MVGILGLINVFWMDEFFLSLSLTQIYTHIHSLIHTHYSKSRKLGLLYFFITTDNADWVGMENCRQRSYCAGMNPHPTQGLGGGGASISPSFFFLYILSPFLSHKKWFVDLKRFSIYCFSFVWKNSTTQDNLIQFKLKICIKKKWIQLKIKFSLGGYKRIILSLQGVRGVYALPPPPNYSHLLGRGGGMVKKYFVHYLLYMVSRAKYSLFPPRFLFF